MRIFKLNAIRPLLSNKVEVINAVRNAFIAHSQGQMQLPNPMQMVFERRDKTLYGDCHVKAASSGAYPYFCIKFATGFYDNPQRDLPVNNGLVMLLSSETGAILALFQDEGHMTSIRTAAAGALAVSVLMDGVKPKSLGVIGTGHQAELQVLWIYETQNISNISIWGRSPKKAQALAVRLAEQGIKVSLCKTLEGLCETSDMIVTTTPSTTPVLTADFIRKGHHIIALGADSPGKRELDPAIIAKADKVIVDDLAQCIEHGELGWAVREDLFNPDRALSFGQLLSGQLLSGQALLGQDGRDISESQISVVDLTGLGAQDLALAAYVYEA